MYQKEQRSAEQLESMLANGQNQLRAAQDGESPPPFLRSLLLPFFQSLPLAWFVVVVFEAEGGDRRDGCAAQRNMQSELALL
eukprot:629827-Rhodomonas_salina.1